ncbi:19803_t:CDS:2, partial [Racocetra fulgida]
ADDESFEYYSVCDNNMVNEALTEVNNETLTEENNKAQPEIHSDNSQQSDDELDDSECEEQIKLLKIAKAYLDDYAKQQEFLTPQILQKHCDQMAQSLCYDVYLIVDWQPLLEEIAREDDYDQLQSLFSSLLKDIPYNSVKEVWKVVRHRGPKQKYGFGMGHAKKALDLEIKADKVEEFVKTQHNNQVSAEEKHDSQGKDLNVEVQVTD